MEQLMSTTPEQTINWTRIGRELRESVIDAHGTMIAFDNAVEFLIDNLDIFGLPESVEIPIDDNCDLVMAYKHAHA